jgi:uncharacterized membrane protein YqaE (UPF0057 family)
LIACSITKLLSLTVWVKCGICSADSLINILLSILGYLPGLLHAWYVIAKYPEPPYEYESLPRHDERVSYVYVQVPAGQHQGQQGQQSKPQPHGGMNYGTQGGSSSQNHSASQPQQQGVTSNGEGSSDGNNHGVPPSYAEVVAGDHKVQTRD